MAKEDDYVNETNLEQGGREGRKPTSCSTPDISRIAKLEVLLHIT